MKALVYLAVGKKALDERPKPEIAAPTDAIVKISRTTICGTDLHILKGDLPSCKPGRILGHEGVGVFMKTVGAGVTVFKPGDHVLIACVSACGKCVYCRKQMYSHCTTGGWMETTSTPTSSWPASPRRRSPGTSSSTACHEASSSM